eukprot:5098047-Prymnesium_polylepis.3
MAMDILFNFMLGVVILIGLSVYANIILLSLPLYLALYVVQNLWKPWSLAAVSDLMGKKRRATVLSVESLIETVLEFVLAPVVGYVAHTFSIEAVFLGLGGIFLVVNNLLLIGDWGEPPALATSPAPTETEMAEAKEAETQPQQGAAKG